MILKGEEYCVNVNVCNLTSLTTEFESVKSFTRRSQNPSACRVAEYLRKLAEDIENNVDLDGEEND